MLHWAADEGKGWTGLVRSSGHFDRPSALVVFEDWPNPRDRLGVVVSADGPHRDAFVERFLALFPENLYVNRDHGYDAGQTFGGLVENVRRRLGHGAECVSFAAVHLGATHARALTVGDVRVARVAPALNADPRFWSGAMRTWSIEDARETVLVCTGDVATAFGDASLRPVDALRADETLVDARKRLMRTLDPLVSASAAVLLLGLSPDGSLTR